MVAAQQEEVLRVFDLVGQQQADALEPVRSAVNVVAASRGEGGGGQSEQSGPSLGEVTASPTARRGGRAEGC